MNKGLDILDNMEEIRQKAAENPEKYSTDYTIRFLEAIVAGAFGYEDRTEWTDRLKKLPESRYYQRYNGDNFHV